MDMAKLQCLLDEKPECRKALQNLVRLAHDLLYPTAPESVTPAQVQCVASGDFLSGTKHKPGPLIIDAAKQARFKKYRTSIEELVGMARRDETLAFAIDEPLRQIDNLIGNISGTMSPPGEPPIAHSHDTDAIRGKAREHTSKMTEIKRKGVQRVAEKSGKRRDDWANKGLGSPPAHLSDQTSQQKRNWYRTLPVTVASVVDLLVAASQSTSQALERGQARKMLFILAMSDGWWITAPVHPSDSDSRPHVTLFVEPGGSGDQFHVYVYETNHGGFCLNGQITHGKKATPL